MGWSAIDFADNSVIGHARRFNRREQSVLLGAGALLVRCDRQLSFFPRVYNEDWLFLIGQAMLSTEPLRATGWAGNVGRDPYQPFHQGRAKREEIGDTLAEGLMNLLEYHGRDLASYSTIDFWRQCQSERSKLISPSRRPGVTICAGYGSTCGAHSSPGR